MRYRPAIKQLLTLRNPDAFSSPSASRLTCLFRKTSADARLKGAGTAWLVLTTCTLLTANTSSVGHLYRFVTRSKDVQGSVRHAALMREAALKSTIFVGVPRVIGALAGLTDALEDDVKAGLRTTSRRTANPENIDAIIARGIALWNSIYEPHAVKLHDKLASYHPDLISFIIQSYGSVLSPLPGGADEQGNLSRALGSVVGIACLRTEGRVGPQLTSHVYGLLKARTAEGLSEEDRWLASDEGTEWVIRTIDTLLDVVIAERG
ncbi:hypothetical protein DFH94DRAFT_717607 [Russula ochroleuca]|uniref:Uncharacterized protein n=1 Tax=Russula ochroleuca TaxID=152965 RepID=A0A9P5N2X1_9AGAM|nr:hypothetical protein DFH94DRAFT_717607 [Russula ochroleuca]